MVRVLISFTGMIKCSSRARVSDTVLEKYIFLKGKNKYFKNISFSNTVSLIFYRFN